MSGLAEVLSALARHPAATVGAGRTEWTFAELGARVGGAAARLARHGVGPGARVGLLAASSLEWWAVELATLALGGVSVPFEAGYAWDVAQLAADWNLQVLVSDRGAGLDLHLLAAERGPLPEPHVYRAADPYTVKFSSGTSARPKAVAACVAHFDHMARHIDAMFPLGPDDVFVVFGSLATWLQRFVAQRCLVHGARVCLAAAAHARAVLERERPTLVLGVPRLLESLHVVSHRRGLAETWGGRLRYLWTGSAPIDRALLEAYERASVPVYEGYGMTETGMIAKNYPGHRRMGSVGLPFPEKTVKLSPAGEILVRSDHHASDRYLQGEEGVYRADGWVATGDLGRFDEDGYLYVVGRLKDTIVLQSGHKAFPPAIEEALRAEPEIGDCAVFGHGRSHLVAVLVPRSADLDLTVAVDRYNAAASGPDRILGFLRASPFVELGLTTATGKLNRAQLVEHFGTALSGLYR